MSNPYKHEVDCRKCTRKAVNLTDTWCGAYAAAGYDKTKGFRLDPDDVFRCDYFTTEPMQSVLYNMEWEVQ